MLTRSAPMKRAPFKAKAPERREAKQVQYVARPREVATASVALPMAQPVLKTPDAHDQRIRDSARGEACTVRLGVAHGTVTQRFHNDRADAVEAIYVFPLPPGATRDSVMLDWFMGHMRSLVILKQKGLV